MIIQFYRMCDCSSEMILMINDNSDNHKDNSGPHNSDNSEQIVLIIIVTLKYIKVTIKDLI